jgi:hypothetical protein
MSFSQLLERVQGLITLLQSGVVFPSSLPSELCLVQPSLIS